MAIKNISQYVSTGTGEDKMLLSWDMNLEAHRSLAPRNLFASEYDVGFGTSNALHALHVLRNGAASLKVESQTGDALLVVDSASGSRWPAVGWDRSGVRKFTAGLQEDDTWAIAVGSDPNTEPSIEIDGDGGVGFPKGLVLPEGQDIYTSKGNYTPVTTGEDNVPFVYGGARNGHYTRIGNSVWFSVHFTGFTSSQPTLPASRLRISIPVATSSRLTSVSAFLQSGSNGPVTALLAFIPQGAGYVTTSMNADAITTNGSLAVSGWYPIAE